jgi:folate-binding protein YgfZ|tara:strand:+ start:422 stop:1309 length:888 start_codon:yes stop_codon:yes gene_type:complete
MNFEELSGYSIDKNTTCIQVSGEDSQKFLQGQFSNDITEVTDSVYQYSSYSTNQGKVIAIFRILKNNQGYLLLINKDVAKYFIERLSMYILMSKVIIEEQKDCKIYGVLGKSANNILLNNILKENEYIKSSDNIILNNKNKYMPAATIIKIKSNNSESDELLQSEINVDYNVNELIDNLLLLPRITMATKETYIPQVLNLEDLNGINYKKGCYTGQEIVARTHYLGKIKKKIFLLEHNEKDIDAGDKIHDDDGELVGEIFTSAQKINDIFLSIGVIRLDSIDKNIYAKENSLKII